MLNKKKIFHTGRNKRNCNQKTAINFGVSDKLMLSFPNVISLNRPTLIPFLDS